MEIAVTDKYLGGYWEDQGVQLVQRHLIADQKLSPGPAAEPP